MDKKILYTSPIHQLRLSADELILLVEYLHHHPVPESEGTPTFSILAKKHIPGWVCMTSFK